MLNIARSGYYAWTKEKVRKRKAANQILDKKIIEVFTHHRGNYGCPRITDELRENGERCARHRVARRMRHLGLRAKAKRKFKVTTDSNHQLPVAGNLLNRDFSASGPNQKWAGDITYIRTEEGWLYLAVVIDLYSRAVIGWSMKPHLSRDLVCDALMMGLWRRGFPHGVLFHSDRGSQYCSADYQKLLNVYGLTCSMSRKGNCWDNAVVESFFHTLKTELIYMGSYSSRDIAKREVFQYIESYYNRVRRHSALGSIAPMVFEDQFRKVV